MWNLLERKEFCNAFPSYKSKREKAFFKSLLKGSQTLQPPCLHIGNCLEPVTVLLDLWVEQGSWHFARSQLHRSRIYIWCCSEGFFFQLVDCLINVMDAVRGLWRRECERAASTLFWGIWVIWELLLWLMDLPCPEITFFLLFTSKTTDIS